MASYQPQRYLSPNGFYEAAKAFGTPISKPKIYEALESRTLLGFRTGTHWRIPVEEITDYFDRQLLEAQGKPTVVHRGLLGTPVEAQ